MNKNIPYYLTVSALFTFLKICYTLADNDKLIFLLAPTNKLVEVLTGSQSFYHSDIGYHHEKLNILIDKSCAGFNFWLICFVMLAFLTLKYYEGRLSKLLVIQITLACAYVLTIFVNASRIFVSIIVQGQATKYLNSEQQIIHETIGIITNLSFLILLYCIIERFLINKQNNAQPA